MLTSPRIEDKHQELITEPDTNIPLNLGVPVEPWPEFPELVVQVLTEMVRVPLVINVEREECLLP